MEAGSDAWLVITTILMDMDFGCSSLSPKAFVTSPPNPFPRQENLGQREQASAHTDDLQRELRGLHRELDTLRAEKHAWDAESHGLHTAVADLTSKRDQSEALIEGLQANVAALLEERDAAYEQCSTLRADVARLQGELEAVEVCFCSGQVFPLSVQFY